MSSTMTLRSWGERWLRIKEEEGLRSIRDMRCHWRCHVLEAGFIDRPLAEIRRSDVRDFMRSRLGRSGRHSRIVPGGGRATTDTGRPLSRSMVTKTAHLLHGAFAYAVEEELIEANPSSGLRLILPARVEDGWTFLSTDEIERIASCRDMPEEQRIIYLTLIYTGLRKGEAWGLRWSDVILDGDRPQIIVRRSYAGPPKNGRIGYVPLLPMARKLLLRWRRSTGDTDLVFPWRSPDRFGAMRGRGSTARWADYWPEATAARVGASGLGSRGGCGCTTCGTPRRATC